MRHLALKLYVSSVSLAGLAALGFLPALDRTASHLVSLEFLVLGVFVVLGELYPLRLPRAGREGIVTVSTTFAFALLLRLGVTEALVALVVASVAGDVVRRRSLTKALFNAAQLTLCVVLSGAVLQALRVDPPSGPVPFADTGLAVTAVTGAVFFLANFVLSGVAVALAARTSVLRLLRRDVLSQATWTAVLLSVSPIVVAVAETSVALLPLLLAPMVAVYKSMEVFVQREREALLDPLTGLPNRALFADRVTQAVLRARRSHEQAAIAVLNLDRFKDVNRIVVGDRGGDHVLRLIGQRLRNVVRDSDTVAHLGGDEFGLVVSPVDADLVGPTVVSRLLEAVGEPIHVGDVTMSLEASVGIALTPDHGGDDPEALMMFADTAMRQAKQVGSAWELHEPVRFRETENRMARLQGLRTALREGHLLLHFQPQVAMESGRIEAVEALVRWEDPEQGMIMPDLFIPLAEESGVIRDLTRFVLSSALDMVCGLRREGLQHRVAVNVAARDLQDPALPDEVSALLARFGVDASLLELEITERTIMSNPVQAAAVIGRLRALGVLVAVDDFGTGNTSLRVLSELPVDSLKIDRSLVRGLSNGGADAAIVQTIIELAHRLDMTVVAEGVETVELLEQLRQLGCDSVQGYLYGRPLPAADLRNRLLVPP